MNAVTLTGAVMTHPRRLAAAEEIAAKDPQGRIRVVQDPDPSGPPTALRTANPSWSCVGATATHHIVFQDDVVLARGFFSYAEEVAAQVPGEAVAFYEGWEGRNSGVVRLGALTGASWAYALDEHVPSLALMLPAEVARGYVRFAAEYGGGWPYDVVIQRYLKACGIKVRIAVPSTVDHDDVPSIAGNSLHGWRRATFFSEIAPDTGTRDCISFPVVPFYQYGESVCAVRHGSRWEYLDTARYLRRIGVWARCDSDFAGVGEVGLPAEVSRQVWLTAFATGVVVAGLTKRDPDSGALDAVMDALGPGGLCEEYTGVQLLSMIPRIRELALAGFAAGRAAHRTDVETAQPADPAAEVVVIGGSPSFGEYLAGLLTDAGRPATYRERLDTQQGRAAPQAVVHLGGPDRSTYTVQDMLADAEKAKVQRLVHVGSAEIYRGLPADAHTEDALSAAPQDPGARAQWDDEQSCLLWGAEMGVPVQVVRLAEQVGRYAPLNGVLATWMLRAWTRQPITLVNGRAHQVVDHRDTAGALAVLLNSPVKSRIYNVASACFDEQRFAELAAETARPTPHEWVASVEKPHIPLMNTALITSDTGWRASAPVQNGSRAQAQWLACDTHDDLKDLLRRESDG